MNVEIVTIGDELLLGFTVDTNAAWLSRELAGIGVTVMRRTTVGDEAVAIAGAVRDALSRTGAVITTGGLGPTSDDRTKPAIASLFGRELHFDAQRWENLRRMWKERGRSGDPPDSNRQQVMIPQGATVLNNRHGSAPGIFLSDERGRWVAMLPGVPREMRGLLADELLPLLRKRTSDDRRVVKSATLRTTGIAESQLPELLGEYAGQVDEIPLAYLPGVDGVDLRLTVHGLPVEEADARLERAAALLRARLGKYVYADGAKDMAEVVLELCRAERKRLSCAESCTGGLLGARITSIAGSSDVFLGGNIVYANEAKVRLLGVNPETIATHGAVSEPVAREMAAGARRALSADIAMAITGIAGPGGGLPEKPVGLVWIAVDFGDEARVYGGRFLGDRAEIRYRSTQSALDIVRRRLTGYS